MTDAPHHPHSHAALAERFGCRYRWKVLLTVMVGAMASVMATTIVNVAVPDISRVFHLGQERAQWLSSGFMAAMTLSMLTTPWLLERFGYRHTYIGVVLLLMGGGILGGLSPWFGLVLAMRVVEGLAAGVLQPIPAILVMRIFASGEQGRAMGIFGFGVVLTPAVGPSIGGVLVEWFGWRSIFFAVVPFCVVAVLLARRYLPIATPSGGALQKQGARLDVVGLALISVAVLALLNGMVELHGPAAATGWALLACAATAFIGFVFHQRRGMTTPRLPGTASDPPGGSGLAWGGPAQRPVRAKPLMELRLFGHRTFTMGAVVAFIYGMALFGSTYLIPVFMQLALHLPPSVAGNVMLPAGVALAITIPLAGRMVDRLPTGRIVATGLALMASSFFLMATVGPAMSLWWTVLWTALGRLGLGFVLPSLNLGSMRGLPADFISHGASTINFMRQIGGAVGISLVGIVLEWRLQTYPSDPVRAFHQTFALVGVITALAVVSALRMGGAQPRLRQPDASAESAA